MSASFSVLILTLNEEINISDCINSVSWCDDIVILDSLSSDRTCEIAKSMGARVFSNKFEDFGSQRNYALDNITFKYSWIFHLDADERFNENLREECIQVIRLDEMSAYFVPNRIIFLGKWIRRCTQYPYPQVRLIKFGEVRFSKSGHGQKEDFVKRGVGNINTPYDHYNFSKGIEEWIAKHNLYSSEEARLSEEIASIQLSKCFSSHRMIRNRALKSLFIRMPMRPLIKFCFLFFFKLGFLDGYPGYVYCRLQAIYELLICLKVREMNVKTSSGYKRKIE